MNLDLTTIGFILIIAGVALIVFSGLSGKADSKFAVVGFIGPIPLGFGNDPRLLQIALIAGAVIFILLIIFLTRGFA